MTNQKNYSSKKLRDKTLVQIFQTMSNASQVISNKSRLFLTMIMSCKNVISMIDSTRQHKRKGDSPQRTLILLKPRCPMQMSTATSGTKRSLHSNVRELRFSQCPPCAKIHLNFLLESSQESYHFTGKEMTNFPKFIEARILTVCLTPKPIVFPPYLVAAVNS